MRTLCIVAVGILIITVKFDPICVVVVVVLLCSFRGGFLLRSADFHLASSDVPNLILMARYIYIYNVYIYIHNVPGEF